MEINTQDDNVGTSLNVTASHQLPAAVSNDIDTCLLQTHEGRAEATNPSGDTAAQGSNSCANESNDSEAYDSDPEDKKYIPAGEDEHDDMLYDPDSDNENEEWVQRQRQGHQSDGILSCACCFSTVCIDCEQHPSTANQFRAIAVQDCSVRESPPPSSQRQIVCDNCNSVIGFYDADEEVYYFVDVLCSEP